MSSGDVALVEEAPDGLSPVSEADFRHALIQAAAQGQIKPVPKPGDKKYEELKEKALEEIFDSIWIQGQAAEMGISVTKKEIAEELAKLKKKAFKTEQQYKEFLKEAHFTPADVDARVTIQMLSDQIQEQITEKAPKPSKGEIEELLRSRQVEPVHDGRNARNPRDQEQGQGQSRSSQGRA